MESLKIKDEFTGYVIDNRYHIQKLLGEGGFGAVFEGQHIILGEPIRKIAIKIIKKSVPVGKEKKIFSEAIMQVTADSILSDEARNRIVQIYDFGIIKEKNRVGYIVMELIEGGDLSNELQAFHGAPMPENIANGYIIEIVKGLAGLHLLDHPIIHRDLKPENILLTENKEIKVADFGLAVRLNNAYHWAEGVAGTQVYMAPETLQNGYAFTQSDVFSIGCIWYQLLTNKYPFNDDVTPDGREDQGSAKWRYEQRKNIIPKSPSKYYNNTVSEQTEHMIGRCLKFNHVERYTNARELLNALLEKTKTREDYLHLARSSYENNKNQDSYSYADQGIAFDSSKNDFTQFKLKLIKAEACVKLDKLNEAVENYTKLRFENDKMKWIYKSPELINLYTAELDLHIKLNHKSKVKILTNKISRLKG